jgi:hypothetical protein
MHALNVSHKFEFTQMFLCSFAGREINIKSFLVLQVFIKLISFFPSTNTITVDFTKLWPRQLRGWLGIWEL